MNDKQSQCPYYEDKCDDLECFCPKYKAFVDVQNPQIVADELASLGVTSNMDSFEKMMTMQKHFASRFHPIDNVNKEITDKWNKEYCICIEDEVEELFDYCVLPINSRPLLHNDKELQKEVIDILHFMMDIFITGNCSTQEIYNRVKKLYGAKYTYKDERDDFTNIFYNIIDDIAALGANRNQQPIESLQFLWLVPYTRLALGTRWNELLYSFALELLFVNRKIRQQISWKHWKKPNKEINYDRLYDVYAELFYKFMRLAVFLFKTPEDIVNTYINKNIENIRRQKNGY